MKKIALSVMGEKFEFELEEEFFEFVKEDLAKLQNGEVIDIKKYKFKDDNPWVIKNLENKIYDEIKNIS